MLEDATVNNAFKREWSRHNPRTLAQVQGVANKVVRVLNKRDVCSKYVAHFPDLCREIKQKAGGASHFMK